MVKCEETDLELWTRKSLEFFKWIHLLEFLYGIFIYFCVWMVKVLSCVQIQWNLVLDANVCKCRVWVIGKTFRVEALIMKCALFISPWNNLEQPMFGTNPRNFPKSLYAWMADVWITCIIPKHLALSERHQAELRMINNQHVPNLWFRISGHTINGRYGPGGLPSATRVFANLSFMILRRLILTGITYWSGDSCRGHQGFWRVCDTWDDWIPPSIDRRIISES